MYRDILKEWSTDLALNLNYIEYIWILDSWSDITGDSNLIFLGIIVMYLSFIYCLIEIHR